MNQPRAVSVVVVAVVVVVVVVVIIVVGRCRSPNETWSQHNENQLELGLVIGAIGPREIFRRPIFFQSFFSTATVES